MAKIIGRDAEVSAVNDFLEQLRSGPSLMLLEGEPGIGKTVLWRDGVERALGHSYRVLACHPAEADARLSHAALADLLAGTVDEFAAAIPSPQRRALDAALRRGGADGVRPDPLGLYLAVHGILRQCAREVPVLVAIDDVQWLDRPTRQALEFAFRRVRTERIGLLVSRRSGAGQFPVDMAPAAEPKRIDLGALGPGALHRVIAERTGISLSRPVLLRLHATAGGNPFFALELARALTARGGGLEPGEPLPVPANLRDLVRDRLARLPLQTRRLLWAAAALSRPTVELLARTRSDEQRVMRDLDRAIDAGIVELHGDVISFTHPLLASVHYLRASPLARRRLHARLSRIVDDPEERARHAALGIAPPDEAVATELEVSAGHAQGRGAPDAAADLLEQSLRFTPTGRMGDVWRRSVLTARFHFHAGNRGRARELLEQVVAEAPAGVDRAKALALLAEVHTNDDSASAATDLLTRALSEAEGDTRLSAEIEMHLCFNLVAVGTMPAADPHARAALHNAEADGSPPLIAQALAVTVMIDFLLGRGIDEERLERALALEDIGATVFVELSPSLMAGLMMLWSDRVERARRLLRRLREQLLVRGEHSDFPYALFHLTWAEWARGDLDAAAAIAEETFETSLQTGGGAARSLGLAAQALVCAWRGEADAAKAQADESLALAEEAGWIVEANWCRHVLGLVASSRGNPAEVHEALAPLVEGIEQWGMADPGPLFFLPDEIEALVALGELDRAEALIDGFEERAGALRRRWALFTAGRCRALLSAARGDLLGGLELAERAVDDIEQLELPFEVGRSLLVRAQIERRLRRWGAARVSLERALAVFEHHRFTSWAARAHSDLARLGGRRKSGSSLTEAERRVASLAASGLTNRQVAGALFISPKSVEANLAKAYRKLRIATRAELGAAMAVRVGSDGHDATTAAELVSSAHRLNDDV